MKHKFLILCTFSVNNKKSNKEHLMNFQEKPSQLLNTFTLFLKYLTRLNKKKSSRNYILTQINQMIKKSKML